MVRLPVYFSDTGSLHFRVLPFPGGTAPILTSAILATAFSGHCEPPTSDFLVGGVRLVKDKGVALNLF
jgi:hypothetical protein